MDVIIQVVQNKLVNFIRLKPKWRVDGPSFIMVVEPGVGRDHRVALKVGFVVEDFSDKVLENALVCEGKFICCRIHAKIS